MHALLFHVHEIPFPFFLTLQSSSQNDEQDSPLHDANANRSGNNDGLISSEDEDEVCSPVSFFHPLSRNNYLNIYRDITKFCTLEFYNVQFWQNSTTYFCSYSRLTVWTAQTPIPMMNLWVTFFFHIFYLFHYYRECRYSKSH